jgi:hypothetical protein
MAGVARAALRRDNRRRDRIPSGVVGTVVLAAALVTTATLVIIRMIIVILRIVAITVVVIIVAIVVVIATVMAAIVVAGVIAVIVGAIVGALAGKGGVDGLELAPERGGDERCREQPGECGSRKQERTPRGVGVDILGGHVILSFGAVRSMDDTMPLQY